VTLKKFKKKSKFGRRSVAREIEEGMKELREKELRKKRSKRVDKFNKRLT